MNILRHNYEKHSPTPLPSLKTAQNKASRALISAICSILLISLLACMHKSPVRRESINREMEELAALITRNPAKISALKGRKVGDTGYYYALDREGIVIFHPQSALAGMNFSGNPLVRRMLEKKAGCLAHYFEGMDRIVLFRPAGNGGILCLTLSLREIEGDGSGCEELK